MLSASRGSIVLFTGAATVLLAGALFALFRAAHAPSPSESSTSMILASLPRIATVPQGYEALRTAPSSTQLQAAGWEARLMSDQRCELSERTGATTTSVGEVPARWCTLIGASIDQRYVHLLSGGEDRCLIADACETPSIEAWNVYDIRIRAFRPVPAPVRGGVWEAVDAVRGIGLFHAFIQSTQQAGVGETWFLTDVAGAGFWNGPARAIEPRDTLAHGERLLSRRDGALLFSYLAVDQRGRASFRLAGFHRGAWQSIDLPEALRDAAWRLERWEQAPKGWRAIVATQNEAGESQEQSITTP